MILESEKYLEDRAKMRQINGEATLFFYASNSSNLLEKHIRVLGIVIVKKEAKCVNLVQDS